VRPWLRAMCLILVVGSVAALVGVGIYYLPLQVDGGWYSYPAFAYSLGRDPFSNQATLAAACAMHGLKSLFQFETTSSIRFFYTSAWFRVLGSGFLSLKLLGLLELALLWVLAYHLFRRFFARRDLALLATAFMLTDKSLILEGVSDFRPDLALAAATVGLFLVMSARRIRPVHIASACLLAVLTALVAQTSAVPLSFVLVATATSAVLSGSAERKRRILLVAAVAVVAVLAFFARAPLFRSGLSTVIQVHDPVDAVHKMSAVLGGGASAVIRKELTRWTHYFLVSNVALLAVLVAGAIALFARGQDGRRVPDKLKGPLLGLAAAMLTLALLDPHITEYHLIPLAPFMLLVLAKFEELARPPLRLLTVLLAGSAALGLGLAYKVWRVNEQRGTNNWWLQSTLAQLTQARRAYVVLGPTELWPYFPKDRDILLVDRTRSPKLLATTGLTAADVDYVMLSPDYDVRTWQPVLQQFSPGSHVVVDKAPFLTVWSIRQPSAGDDYCARRPMP